MSQIQVFPLLQTALPHGKIAFTFAKPPVKVAEGKIKGRASALGQRLGFGSHLLGLESSLEHGLHETLKFFLYHGFKEGDGNMSLGSVVEINEMTCVRSQDK